MLKNIALSEFKIKRKIIENFKNLLQGNLPNSKINIHYALTVWELYEFVSSLLESSIFAVNNIVKLVIKYWLEAVYGNR